MALSKIRQANKTARRHQKRNIKHDQYVKKNADLKVRNKRIRKLMIAGRREQLAKHRTDTAYVNQLERELTGE